VSLDGGEYHTCGVTQDGEARCWGYNGQGQLGDNTKTDRFAPAPVSGGVTFAQ
jgi:alpha-tubulin suppressor-like RCC1 family protein